MNDQDKLMKDKIVLVTGATSGIGMVTALELARIGASVVIAGRSEEKCQATLKTITEETGNTSVEYLVADLSVMAEVRRLASEFKKRYDRLHVLVNNAGGIYSKRRETSEGLEYTFALNHLAYFLLTCLLLDIIKRSAPARIVSVSSGIHKAAKSHFDDLELTRGYSAFKAYGQSKLANVLFTYELARRLDGSGVTATVMSPGMTSTGFGLNNPGFLGVMTKLSNAIGGRAPEKGAETLIWLASSPEVEGLTGKYFEDCKAIPSSKASYDEEVSRRLWDVSEKLTGIKPEIHEC